MSNAVGSERISRIVGYLLSTGDFSETSPNLPQRIVILGEANFANQGSLDISAKEITSAKQAGDLYGYGSPIHIATRILRPNSGAGIGGIPTIVVAQAQAAGAVSKIIKVTPVGTATANVTHTLRIAGRKNVDGSNYDINIVSGDTTSQISAKIRDAVNNVLGCPMIGTYFGYEARLESKWKGLTAEGLTVSIDTGNNAAGITYTVTSIQSGSATPSIAAALALFANEWNTIVVNTYGAVTSIMDALEAFNGIPSPENPTGRYTGIIMKPFVALTGSVLDDPTTITDSRSSQVTISICPAPLSPGLAMEAAANVALLKGRQAQDNPHLDVSGMSYPDMPIPIDKNIGSMADYNNRDSFVKKGCSTVDLGAERYVIQEIVTTYHPVGENPAQFNYVRNLDIDFNVKFGYYLLEQINVVDHAIVADNAAVVVPKTIKPKQWVQILRKYADDLEQRGLITDAAFMKSSIKVSTSTTNPNRFQTKFRYKRSGYVIISDTEATAGFSFGSLNVA